MNMSHFIFARPLFDREKLYFAAKNCDPNDLPTSIRSENIIRKLLASQVDPGWTDENGYTSLMWAAAWGHEEIVEMLVSGL